MDKEKTPNNSSDLLSKIFDYFFKTAFARFWSFVVLIGAGLLSFTLIDLLLVIFDKQHHKVDGTYVLFAQYVGVAMIVIGIIGRTLLHFSDNAKKRAQEKQIEQNKIDCRIQKEKEAATDLAVKITILIDGFADENIVRDDTYYNVQIIACVESAKAFLALKPERFISNKTIAAITKTQFCIPRTRPFYNVPMKDLSETNNQLREQYAIK